MVYHRRENGTGLPDMVISGVKQVWVQKSTLRIPLSLRPYSCPTITTALANNCVLIRIFLEYVVVHFKKRLRTQL
jgi:hypothetical protein